MRGAKMRWLWFSLFCCMGLAQVQGAHLTDQEKGKLHVASKAATAICKKRPHPYTNVGLKVKDVTHEEEGHDWMLQEKMTLREHRNIPVNIGGQKAHHTRLHWNPNGDLCLFGQGIRYICIHPMDMPRNHRKWATAFGYGRVYSWNRDQLKRFRHRGDWKSLQALVDMAFDCNIGKMHYSYVIEAKCVMPDIMRRRHATDWRVIISTTKDLSQTWLALIYGDHGHFRGQSYLRQANRHQFSWKYNPDKSLVTMRLSDVKPIGKDELKVHQVFSKSMYFKHKQNCAHNAGLASALNYYKRPNPPVPKQFLKGYQAPRKSAMPWVRG